MHLCSLYTFNTLDSQSLNLFLIINPNLDPETSCLKKANQIRPSFSACDWCARLGVALQRRSGVQQLQAS